MNALRQELMTFFDRLTWYDYAGFVLAFILFILVMALAVLLRHRIKTALFLALLGLTLLVGGPIGAHEVIRQSLFKHTLEMGEAKKLIYTDSLLIEGIVHYIGPQIAKACKVSVTVHKQTGNYIKDLAYRIKPYKKSSTTIEQVLQPGQYYPLKLIIEPFDYNGAYTVDFSSGCF